MAVAPGTVTPSAMRISMMFLADIDLMSTSPRGSVSRMAYHWRSGRGTLCHSERSDEDEKDDERDDC